MRHFLFECKIDAHRMPMIDIVVLMQIKAGQIIFAESREEELKLLVN